MLTLEKFHCIEDTDPLGLASPSFVSCVLDVQARKVWLRLAPGAHWQERVEKTEAWPVGQVVVDGAELTPQHSLVLVAMLEQPLSVGLSAVHGVMQAALLAECQALGGQGLQGEAGLRLQERLKERLQHALAPTGTLPEVRVVTMPEPNEQLCAVSFPSASGLYKVWFRHSA